MNNTEDKTLNEEKRTLNEHIAVSPTRDAFRRLLKNKLAMIGLVIVLLYFLVALCAPILPLRSYRFQVPEHRELPPSLTKSAGELWYDREYTYMQRLMEKEGRSELTEAEQEKLQTILYRVANDESERDGKAIKTHSIRYLLGTDYLGRDMLSRIIYGSRVSVAVGLVGSLVSIFIGMIFGSIAGYFGGRIDSVIMTIINVMYGLPYMLLVIIFVTIFGSNLVNIFAALAMISWLTAARVVRGQVITMKNQEFIEAARSIGLHPFGIIIKHLLPNSLGIIIVFTTLRIPTFILQEAFLSFLGLGLSAPFASWGTLIGDAVDAMTVAPWRLFYPALAMSLFLLSMNFFGDGLRDAFDPKSKYMV